MQIRERSDSVIGANICYELAGIPLEHRECVSIAPFPGLGVAAAEFGNSSKQAESLQTGLHVRFHQLLLGGLWADSHPVTDWRDGHSLTTGKFIASTVE